jgi:hypothetical protein
MLATTVLTRPSTIPVARKTYIVLSIRVVAVNTSPTVRRR